MNRDADQLLIEERAKYLEAAYTLPSDYAYEPYPISQWALDQAREELEESGVLARCYPQLLLHGPIPGRPGQSINDGPGTWIPPMRHTPLVIPPPDPAGIDRTVKPAPPTVWGSCLGRAWPALAVLTAILLWSLYFATR